MLRETKKRSVAGHEALAKHYKALGIEEVYLDNGPFPWEWVVSCEEGGSHRLEISTNVWFRAKSPKGLIYRWSFDIEPRSANGSGSYHVDVMACRKVVAQLPPAARAAFQSYLRDCAAKVSAKSVEFQQITDAQKSTADDLLRAASV